MRVFKRLMVFAVLMMFAAPAWSMQALHVILCEQDDEISDAQVEQLAADWLKAAKEVKGGENLIFRINFPIAAKSGEIDLAMMLIAPNFTEWGMFMDNYPGSAAEALDDKFAEDLDCGDGTLWESELID